MCPPTLSVCTDIRGAIVGAVTLQQSNVSYLANITTAVVLNGPTCWESFE